MDMTEEWLPIKGYEGLYEISNFGVVKSLQNRVGGRRKPIVIVREFIMSPTDNGHGYKIVGLRKDGKRKNHYVHRLVADAFCEKKDGAEDVNHKDHNRANNNAENLEWVTTKENARYSADLMQHPKAVCRKSNTGEKYITERVHGNRRYFRLNIRHLGVDKKFCDLQSAVNYRNGVIKT